MPSLSLSVKPSPVSPLPDVDCARAQTGTNAMTAAAAARRSLRVTRDMRSSWLMPLRSSRTGKGEQADDLHGDDFHDRHQGKDHRVADVGTFGRRHAGAVDEDRRVAGRAGSDAHQIVVGYL